MQPGHRADMNRPHDVNLKLHLEGRDPVFGSVQDQHGQTYPFFGWVELIELVQRLASAPPDKAGEGPHPL